jgi:hypothetical protein
VEGGIQEYSPAASTALALIDIVPALVTVILGW